MRGELHDQRGLTLVEALISALLLVLILFAAFGLYERAVFTWSREEKMIDLQDHLRVSLNALGTDIREARGLTYVTGPPAKIDADSLIEVEDDSGSESSKLIELQVPDASGNTEEVIRYSWKATGTGDTEYVFMRNSQPLAHQINYIWINSTPDEPRLVEVVLRASSEHRGRPIEVEMEASFYMRATQDAE